MEYRQLGRTGLIVSRLGFGASPLGSVFGEIDEEEGIRAVHLALDLGINLFDVSPFYGATRAETVLGRGLRSVPRDRFVLSTKVGRYGSDEFDFSAARIKTSIFESMERLGVDYLDIVHCHDIEFVDLDQIVREALPTLRSLQAEGRIGFVSVSGLPLHVYQYVLERAELDVILSYCHYSLNDSSLTNLLPELSVRNIGVINAAPLSMGLFSPAGPPEWHPASDEIKAACWAARDWCSKNGVDIARLAVQFSTSNPDIATTLVGMADCETVRKNAAAVSDPIDHSALAEVQRILEPVRNKTCPSGLPENN